MSEFLDDQSNSQNTDANADGAAAPKEGQSPLLLSEMQTPEDMFAPVKNGQRANQAVVAGLLVVGAIGAIFAMRQFGMGPALSLAGIDVDYKPAAISAGTTPKKVLADLDRSRRAVQVPAEFITQAPFELDSAHATIAEPTVDPDLARRAEEERLRLAREQHQQELDGALARLKLQSVMGGSVPIARIDGHVYKVGMRVGEFFTISAIVGRDVTLTADGHSFVLSMDSND